MLKSYISGTYCTELNTNFYDTSRIVVNDNSVPIYDLNYSALSGIEALKFDNSAVVDSIILKIKSLINSGLYNKNDYGEICDLVDIDEIKDQILYDDATSKKTFTNYDSILILPIINAYYNHSELLSEIFDCIFSNLSKESFYRFLIPVGKIDSIFNDRKFLVLNEEDVYKEEKEKTTAVQKLTYYYNVDNIDNLLSDIDFNYFSLKTLSNPHDEYDYEIYKINNDIECCTNMYSISRICLL